MKNLLFKGKVTRKDFELDFDLALPGSGITAFFGESGAGKSTLLRTVAGLVQPSDGKISIGYEIWQDDENKIFVPTHKRSVGFVFQDAALFPHLSVKNNLQYGMKRIPAEKRIISLEKAVDLLGIGHLLDRMPDTLSGGEQQRASIARALATSPDIMLMDEPLAALDMKRKSEIIPYLMRLNTELEIPILYVSHALEEVSVLADHLVLLEKGRIVASGKVNDMLTRLDLPLAYYDVAAAIVNGQVVGEDSEFKLCTIRFSGGEILLPSANLRTGQQVRLRVQARDVSLTTEKPVNTSILNAFEATVVNLSPDSDGQVLIELDVKGTHLLSRITSKSVNTLKLDTGKSVFAQVKGIAVIE